MTFAILAFQTKKTANAVHSVGIFATTLFAFLQSGRVGRLLCGSPVQEQFFRFRNL